MEPERSDNRSDRTTRAIGQPERSDNQSDRQDKGGVRIETPSVRWSRSTLLTDRRYRKSGSKAPSF
ncbi:hypothetical protein [Prochlorothrix hollandica]|uniref:hypothetical protein n=1 Tax=Prochlorothrix hollandica TaxID=1223 RepID=UPI0033409667